MNEQVSIETGYFIFSMMPSLYCEMKCPHCYLTKEQRADETKLSIDGIRIACDKIKDYYKKTSLKNKRIIFYWYGGEPTKMPIEYFTEAVELINSKFTAEEGYSIRHIVLSSLIDVDTKWFDFFNKYCNGALQTSYDGTMRGRNYIKQWEKKVREAIDYGLDVTTITVVNTELIKTGAKKVSQYLDDLGIKQAGWLPMMLTKHNVGKKFDRFAPTMNEWSDFMIDISKEYVRKTKEGIQTVQIGSLHTVVSRDKKTHHPAGVAAQSLFLLPNGDIALQDYKKDQHGDSKEYMRKFGNILEDSFEEILTSKSRISYITNQVTRNMNPECMTCELAHKCLIEAWKENRVGDDCYGAKKYVEWIDRNIQFFDKLGEDEIY